MYTHTFLLIATLAAYLFKILWQDKKIYMRMFTYAFSVIAEKYKVLKLHQ